MANPKYTLKQILANFPGLHRALTMYEAIKQIGPRLDAELYL